MGCTIFNSIPENLSKPLFEEILVNNRSWDENFDYSVDKLELISLILDWGYYNIDGYWHILGNGGPNTAITIQISNLYR